MAREGSGLPPEDQAVATVEALIERARQLQRSVGRLQGTDEGGLSFVYIAVERGPEYGGL